MPIGDARWKRLIQLCVTGCNWGQKRRDSRSIPNARAFGVALDAEDQAQIEAVLAKSRDLYQLIGDCGDEYRR